MDKIGTAILIALATAAALFFAALGGAAFGALGGWIVGWFFDGTLELLAQAMGIDAKPYQLGAMFGFVGSFFKSTLSKSD